MAITQGPQRWAHAAEHGAESVCETKDDGTSQTERERKRREFNDAERAETRGLSWWEQLDDELTKHDAGC